MSECCWSALARPFGSVVVHAPHDMGHFVFTRSRFRPGSSILRRTLRRVQFSAFVSLILRSTPVRLGPVICCRPLTSSGLWIAFRVFGCSVFTSHFVGTGFGSQSCSNNQPPDVIACVNQDAPGVKSRHTHPRRRLSQARFRGDAPGCSSQSCHRMAGKQRPDSHRSSKREASSLIRALA